MIWWCNQNEGLFTYKDQIYWISKTRPNLKQKKLSPYGLKNCSDKTLETITVWRTSSRDSGMHDVDLNAIELTARLSIETWHNMNPCTYPLACLHIDWCTCMKHGVVGHGTTQAHYFNLNRHDKEEKILRT